MIYPAKHFVTTSDRIHDAIASIKLELKERLKELDRQNKILEGKRLESRTNYDLEMLREIGYCSGIENYSRHLSGRSPGPLELRRAGSRGVERRVVAVFHAIDLRADPEKLQC